MKIAVGLSGGVDSSVACYLLKNEGHEVVGLTMKLWDSSFTGTVKKSACFGPDEEHDIEDARSFASGLGIEFHVIDLSSEYRASILRYFKEEYLAGKTPNPCMRCNRSMKFSLLLDKARESGVSFDKFATGHYARTGYDESSKRHLLFRGLDQKKDQSYFLGLLGQDQLSSIIFPLGSFTKDKVKELAKALGFSAYDKKESQDFYSGELGELLDELPPEGKIVDKNGKVLGSHKGICHYTVGQRRGIGVPSNIPLYVTAIDDATNTVSVGTDDELFRSRLLVTDMNWIGIERLGSDRRVSAKIRYMHNAQDAVISPVPDNRVLVEFKEPQRAITPGQYAVFYDGDSVLGAGVIENPVD